MIPFDKRSGKIWYNNELVEWQDAKCHVISHGLHYASLVLEGERVYDGEIFKLEEHTDRLFYSAKRLDINIPYTKDEINEASKKIVAVQNIQNGYVRPFAWRGSEMMGVSAQKNTINVAIATWEWPAYFDPKLKAEGIRLNISAICGELDVDGLRGDIVTNRSARAIAAFEGRTEVQEDDIARVISCSLRHRLRKDPLEQVDSGERVIQAFCKIFDLDEKDNLSKFQLSADG